MVKSSSRKKKEILLITNVKCCRTRAHFHFISTITLSLLMLYISFVMCMRIKMKHKKSDKCASLLESCVCVCVCAFKYKMNEQTAQNHNGDISITSNATHKFVTHAFSYFSDRYELICCQFFARLFSKLEISISMLLLLLLLLASYCEKSTYRIV